MIWIIMVFLSAICNAVMDTLSHHHSTSVFKKHNSGFWADANLVSWKNKYINNDPVQGRRKFLGIIIPVQFTDAWHFFKSLMIILFALSVVFYSQIIYIWTDFVLFGIIWNLTFNLFYNHLLKKK